MDDTVAQQKIDGSGEVWGCTFNAYDATGAHRQLTFTTSKRLRGDAYFRLGYLPIREVVSWDEVRVDQLPQAVREQLSKRYLLHANNLMRLRPACKPSKRIGMLPK